MFFLLVLLSLHSCGNQFDDSVPTCIQDILKDSDLSSDIKTIKVQEIDGNLSYWINTDAMHVDGIEMIVNSQCDTICSYCGECTPPSCIYDYKIEKWDIIWSK